MNLSIIGAAVLVAFVVPAVQAQGAGNYPSKALRMVVPFPPGGGNDILARTLGQRLSEVTGQQVVVDNRGGAGGALGATIAATANPDGYTLFLGSVGNLVSKELAQGGTRHDARVNHFSGLFFSQHTTMN